MNHSATRILQDVVVVVVVGDRLVVFVSLMRVDSCQQPESWKGKGVCVAMFHHLCVWGCEGLKSRWSVEKTKQTLKLSGTDGATERDRNEMREREFCLFSFPPMSVWQPPLLCSLGLYVVGVITRGPGQRLSPLCLIWKTATAPPTAGAGQLCSNIVLGITHKIKEQPVWNNSYILWWLCVPAPADTTERRRDKWLMSEVNLAGMFIYVLNNEQGIF